MKSNPNPWSYISLFFLTSELLDQFASASKSFVTTLPDLPKEKSSEAAVTEPIAIAEPTSLAVGLAPEPIQILLLPVVEASPAFLPR